MRKYFKTKKRLEVFIDRASDIDGAEDSLDDNFSASYFDGPGYRHGDDFNGIPYWAVDSLTYNNMDEIDPEDVVCQYFTGNHCPEWPFNMVSDGYEWKKCQRNINGQPHIFLFSITLPVEVEHQAEDGGLVCEYRGESFIKVFIPTTCAIQ